MFGEVAVVLDVQRGQRQLVVQAARGYPHVVLGTGATTVVGVASEVSPYAGDIVDLVTDREDEDAGQPRFQATAVGRTPLASDGPFGQFAQRDEGDTYSVGEDGGHDRAG